jgi:hypothetical protein
MFKIGDIVTMNKTYPIWLLSTGLTQNDLGIIIDIVPYGELYFDPKRVIKVYWFSTEKSYLLDPRTLIKL